MISRSALKEHTKQESRSMTMANSTPQQEVAREVFVSLGHGSSVQAILDSLYTDYGREEDHHKKVAYAEAICFIEGGLKPARHQNTETIEVVDDRPVVTRTQIAEHITAMVDEDSTLAWAGNIIKVLLTAQMREDQLVYVMYALSHTDANMQTMVASVFELTLHAQIQ